MRALSSSESLTLWERGACLHPLDRSLLALSFAGPVRTAKRRGLAARADAIARCWSCMQHGSVRSSRRGLHARNAARRLEFELNVRDLTAASDGKRRSHGRSGRADLSASDQPRSRASREAADDDTKRPFNCWSSAALAASSSSGWTDEIIEKSRREPRGRRPYGGDASWRSAARRASTSGTIPLTLDASSGQSWRRAPAGCCGKSTRSRLRTAGANPRRSR